MSREAKKKRQKVIDDIKRVQAQGTIERHTPEQQADFMKQYGGPVVGVGDEKADRYIIDDPDLDEAAIAKHHSLIESSINDIVAIKVRQTIKRAMTKPIDELIGNSSLGAALQDVKERGIDAHANDLAREMMGIHRRAQDNVKIGAQQHPRPAPLIPPLENPLTDDDIHTAIQFIDRWANEGDDEAAAKAERDLLWWFIDTVANSATWSPTKHDFRRFAKKITASKLIRFRRG